MDDTTFFGSAKCVELEGGRRDRSASIFDAASSRRRLNRSRKRASSNNADDDVPSSPSCCDPAANENCLIESEVTEVVEQANACI